MSKKDLSEQDIRTKYITPAIIASGWDLHTQIREEVTFTAGRIKTNDYNLDIKNPNTIEDDPGNLEKLLVEYKTLIVSVAGAREILKRKLTDAPGGYK